LKDSLDLLFELSNEDRLSILTALQGSPSKLTEISVAIKLPNQETSRQVARLSTLDLIYRDGKGLYNLTPYAEQVIALMPGFEFLSKYRSYFKTHTATSIPKEFQLRIGELASCALIEDPVTNQYEIQQVITGANEYVWSMVEQVNITLGKHTEDAIRRGANHRVIMPNNLVPSEPYRSYIRNWGPDHPMRSSRAERRFVDNISVALIMSEKEVACILFPTIDGKMDYLGFKSKDSEAHKWCRDLFMNYWEVATESVPKSLAELIY